MPRGFLALHCFVNMHVLRVLWCVFRTCCPMCAAAPSASDVLVWASLCIPSACMHAGGEGG